MENQINAGRTRDNIRGKYGSVEAFARACNLTTRAVNLALTEARGRSNRHSRAKEVIARLERESLLVRLTEENRVSAALN